MIAMVEKVQGVFSYWGTTSESPKKGEEPLPTINGEDIEVVAPPMDHPEEEFKHEFQIITRDQFN